MTALRALRRLKSWIATAPPGPPPSDDYRAIEAEQALDGWLAREVAERQQAAFAPLVADALAGKPRADFKAAADAILETGMLDPSVVEIGCGSAYYARVLPALLGRPLRYTGFDLSLAMVALGARAHAGVRLAVGDARRLPLADDCCDILLSGTVLMHVLEYEVAIEESRRAARTWCIFHTIPIRQNGRTLTLRKRAYGLPVAEVVFNQKEIEECFAGKGLAIADTLSSLDYDLQAVIGERTTTVTYLCRKV
jgi:SAM-dependent methyltransferase